MTDHSLFDRFFNDKHAGRHECRDCGAVENLVVLYTTEEGDQVWICRSCRNIRRQRQVERTARARQATNESLRRDMYEEPQRFE